MTDFTISALRNELRNDPLSLGYGPAIASGDQNTLFSLVNMIRRGGAFQVDRDPVRPEVLFSEVTPEDFAAMTTTELARLQVLMVLPQIDLADGSTKTIVDSLFANGAVTRQNVTILKQRDGSRAEVLWGKGIIVTVNQIDQALQA